MDRLLRFVMSRFIRRGDLRITTARGTTLRFGDGTGRPVAVRFTTPSAQRQLILNPELKLGESYMTYGRHDEAVTSLRAGIQKGGLKDLPDAQTTLGIALYKAGKKDEALAEFRKAEMASTPSGVVAHVWALFLQRPAA